MRSLAVPSSLLLGTFTPQRGAVLVQAHNGWVTLTGTVEDAYERREAEAAVRTLDDVVGVTNLIAMRAGANESDAQTCLVDTLHPSDDRGSDPIRTPGRGDPEDCGRLPELIRTRLEPTASQQICLPHGGTLNPRGQRPASASIRA